MINRFFTNTGVILGAGIPLAVLFGLFCGYRLRKVLAEKRLGMAEKLSQKIIKDAEKEAEAKRREASLEAKDELYQSRTEFERQTQARRNELLQLEKRLIQREENLDRKVDILEKKEKDVSDRENVLQNKEKAIQDRNRELAIALSEEKEKLQRISGLSAAEARKLLLQRLENELSQEKATVIKRVEEETKAMADKKAKGIISVAIQRCASEHVAETTVSVVALPSDEMKGRIIGREGRNIRALEKVTGVDVIIDDTPEAVILSAFDPIRREIAKITLERLVVDGRIHPARIEEVVEKVKQEIEVNIRNEGEQAAFEMGVQNLHPEEIRLLGRLKYRSSYGQNVLHHSKEVAFLAGVLAAEINENVASAKRAGLLHDIGKAIDREVEGTHAQISADIARKYNEAPEIVHAIASHHEEQEAGTVLAVLIQAADAISAARPGARRETLEAYIKRLEKLEGIAKSFKGVAKCYAIQAGREIRVIVEPDRISDIESAQLSREISKKIEESLDYPGQIKVTVIRETRAVEYAK